MRTIKECVSCGRDTITDESGPVTCFPCQEKQAGALLTTLKAENWLLRQELLDCADFVKSAIEIGRRNGDDTNWGPFVSYARTVHCSIQNILTPPTLPKEEQEANARLIAAAPMMLETLEWIGRQQSLFFTECDQAEKILHKVLETVRAATKVSTLLD